MIECVQKVHAEIDTSFALTTDKRQIESFLNGRMKPPMADSNYALPFFSDCGKIKIPKSVCLISRRK